MRLLLLLSILVVVAAAFPFGPKSGVIEATPKTFNGLLKTHKPVFVMFYAPWCGHCKQMHPDYEKFAKNMKGMARVIAVNGDAHRELSGKFGVQGFPTIKYYGMGDKAKAKPQDYQGARKVGAMTKAAMDLVKNDYVIPLKKTATTSDIKSLMAKTTAGKVAILVSNKNTIPPMWAVVAASAQLSGATFAFASEKINPSLVKSLGITSFPTIAVLSGKDDGEDFASTVYKGSIEYDSIAKFILSELGGGGGGDSSESSTNDEPKRKGKKDKSGEKTAQSDTEKDEDVPSHKEEKKPQAASNPKPALPVAPTALAKHSLEFYCSAKAMKIKGKSPLCVISANDQRDLTSVHAKYSNEPVLFFYATDTEDVRAIVKALDDSEVIGEDDVLLLRSFKESGAKFAVMKGTDDLDSYLGKTLEGSVSLKKAPFPNIK